MQDQTKPLLFPHTPSCQFSYTSLRYVAILDGSKMQIQQQSSDVFWQLQSISLFESTFPHLHLQDYDHDSPGFLGSEWSAWDAASDGRAKHPVTSFALSRV